MTTTLFDPTWLRHVFGAFPSGVAVVAAVVDTAPVGIAASSFTSVSLDPALVSLCIAHTSTTWPVLREVPRLGVSILSAAGDHDIVVLRVHDLDADHGISPLVFHAGQFRRLEP
jgi:flavin reductase (DIM6/NTAB) family NADH-FMN oxidoreductase RutF